MRLSLILPCFNEEQNIEQTVRDVVEWFGREKIEGEIIVVNDGSVDGTALVLEQLASRHANLRIVTHEKNLGYGSAVRSGCDEATMEYVGYMDSDGQFHPEDLSRLLPLLAECDFVTGRRLKRADPLIRSLNAKLYGLLVFAILGIWVRDINCGKKIWKREIWPKIRPRYSTGALINGEVFYRLRRHGIRWKQEPVRHFPRRHGKQTGANIKVIYRMFRDLFALKRACLREKD